MENNKNQPQNKKVSSVFIIIGSIVIGIGLIFAIWGFIKVANFMSSGDMPWPLFIGMPMFMFGLMLLLVGLRPKIAKLNAKLYNETLDVAGDEIKEAGMNTIDLAAPVVDKAVDSITPNITQIVKSVKDGVSEEKTEDTMYCKHCGKLIDADSKFCKHCAKEQ